MLSSLFNPRKAEKHFFEMFLIGFVYSSLSIVISYWIFSDYASLAMVFLSILPCIYVIHRAIKLEEKKEKDYHSEEWILREHFRTLGFFLCLFLGFVFSFSLWAFLLSPEKASILFAIQKSSVEQIRGLTGSSILPNSFYNIIANNFKVLFLSLILALFYGAGAIFVLAWNASIMGFVIGNLARNSFGIAALPIAFTKYFLHGIPEMFAYLTAALAGGILYIAFLNDSLLEKGKSKRIIIDVSLLIIISAVLLVIAALIEIYVSPLV